MAIPGMDLQAQYEQTLQNTIGKSQRERLQDTRKQQTLANTDWSQRGVGQGAQRMAGFQEVNPSSMPNMSDETKSWIKPLLGTYQEGGQNVEGFYGKDNPYTQGGLESILSTQGYARAPTSLEGQFRAAGLKLPNAYGQNYYNAQHEAIGNQLAPAPAYYSIDPNAVVGQATDLNKLFNEVWSQQQNPYGTFQYQAGVNHHMVDVGGDGGGWQSIGSTPNMHTGYTFGGNKYTTKEEADAQRQATYNFLNSTQDKNLLRNAIVDIQSGSSPGSFGFTDPGYTFNGGPVSSMGSDVENPYTAFDKRAANTNAGKLGWNEVNEKLTDANKLAQLFGGRSVTGTDGKDLGFLFSGEDVLTNPTLQHIYEDNSRSDKNFMYKTNITDIQDRYAASGARLNPDGLLRSGQNDLYIKPEDYGKLSGDAYGWFQNNDIWNRQKSPTALAKVAKLALETVGGPFGKIAGLALGNATGQTQASIGQVAMTAASMFGGGGGDGGATDYLSETLGITPAQASALYQGATRIGGGMIDGRSLQDSLLAGASGAVGGYLGNETGGALKGLFDNKLVGNAVGQMGSSAVSGTLNKALLNRGSTQDIALNSILAGLGSSIDGYMSPKDKQPGLDTLKSPTKTNSMYNQSRQRTV